MTSRQATDPATKEEMSSGDHQATDPATEEEMPSFNCPHYHFVQMLDGADLPGDTHGQGEQSF